MDEEDKDLFNEIRHEIFYNFPNVGGFHYHGTHADVRNEIANDWLEAKKLNTEPKQFERLKQIFSSQFEAAKRGQERRECNKFKNLSQCINLFWSSRYSLCVKQGRGKCPVVFSLFDHQWQMQYILNFEGKKLPTKVNRIVKIDSEHFVFCAMRTGEQSIGKKHVVYFEYNYTDLYLMKLNIAEFKCTLLDRLYIPYAEVNICVDSDDKNRFVLYKNDFYQVLACHIKDSKLQREKSLKGYNNRSNHFDSIQIKGEKIVGIRQYNCSENGNVIEIGVFPRLESSFEQTHKFALGVSNQRNERSPCFWSGQVCYMLIRTEEIYDYVLHKFDLERSKMTKHGTFHFKHSPEFMIENDTMIVRQCHHYSGVHIYHQYPIDRFETLEEKALNQLTQNCFFLGDDEMIPRLDKLPEPFRPFWRKTT